MYKSQFPHKILWLASYPKSGNTWFRAFLSALFNEGNVTINEMETDGIFSAREIFDLVSDLSSRNLYDEEVKLLIPDVYRHRALQSDQMVIVKAHDAFTYNDNGQSIFPEDATHAAVYFVRNPLDIAGSLANHNNCTIDEAVNMLNNPKSSLAVQRGNLNRQNQFKQYMSDWSTHARSWIEKPRFPVHVIRYEDMLTDPFATFTTAVKSIGWHVSDEEVSRAIVASSFDKLSRQEAEQGFTEKYMRSPRFFRSGKMNNWENELSAEQVTKIRAAHGELMLKFNYC